MQKYYSYSVKDLLTESFPGNSVTEMRAKKQRDATQDQSLTARAWAYADNQAIQYFLGDYFLQDTLLCEDYMVYIVQRGRQSHAFLSFLHFEDDLPPYPDPEYAFSLCEEWKSKGYDPVILRICVGLVEQNDGSIDFNALRSEGMEPAFLIPVKGKETYFYTLETDPFWQHATALFYAAVTSGLRSEYEKIFSEDAILERCPDRTDYEKANDKYENAETVAEGIDGIKAYFDGIPLPTLAYVRRGKHPSSVMDLISDGKRYVPFVGGCNQFTRIIEEPISDSDSVIPVPSELLPRSVTMPDIVGVRPLDETAVHAYGLRLDYSDGCVKHYYLHTFDTPEIPESFSLDGYRFDKKLLNTVRHSAEPEGKGVIFSNGYRIPAHVLYYRGTAQMIPEKIGASAFRGDRITLTGSHRIPLKIRRGVFLKTFVPRPDAFYGASEALMDGDGNRYSDYSGSHFDSDPGESHASATKSEANGKVGYLKGDGSWMIPPIFDDGEAFDGNGCALAKKDGQRFLVNRRGEILPFEYEINMNHFADGLCEFSVERYDGEVTYPEEEFFDHVSPGLWGFIDEYGKIVVEPKYVFTSGFGFVEKRAFVARITEGKTLWGLIDETGKEVIPCIYPNLSTHSGTSINFQREEKGKYGIMDFDGNILMEPCYRLIQDYDDKHRLVAAGDTWDTLGVTRISDGKTVVPFLYEYIVFEDAVIECEPPLGGTDFYEYDGNKLSENYASLWKHGENFCTWKNNKCGVIDKDGNTVLPFIFEEASHISYYEQGFLITGTKGKRGLSKCDGTVILPEKYTDITVTEDFIIASCKTDANWDIRDELYLTDGTPVFDDLYRRVCIKGEILTRETPLGLEYYRITRSPADPT